MCSCDVNCNNKYTHNNICQIIEHQAARPPGDRCGPAQVPTRKRRGRAWRRAKSHASQTCTTPAPRTKSRNLPFPDGCECVQCVIRGKLSRRSATRPQKEAKLGLEVWPAQHFRSSRAEGSSGSGAASQICALTHKKSRRGLATFPRSAAWPIKVSR